MQSFSGIESYVKLATCGFTVVKALVNFFLSLNIAWLVTSMPFLSRGRRCIVGIFSVGFLAEVATMWFSDTSLIMEWGIGDIEILRTWTRVVAIATLLLSSLFSCVFPSKKCDSSITVDDFIAKLNAQTQVESSAKRATSPNNSVTAPRFATGSVREGPSRYRARMRPDKFAILHSDRNCNAGRRRSRSSYRPSSTELIPPVVTPEKSIAQNNIAARRTIPRSHEDYQTTYYAHHSEAIARQGEGNRRSGLDATHGTSSEEDTKVSSSDEARVDMLPVKKNNKRNLSEMNASEEYFPSTNDDEMSTSSSDVSSAQTQEKKYKLTDFRVH
jgi:hypothetical protein